MVRVRELTSEALLSAPRRSPPVPNRDGTRALYTVTSTTLGYKTTKDLRVLNLETGSSLYLCNDDRDHDAAWIPGTRYDVIWLRSVDGGKTHVMVANAVNMRIDHYAIAVIPAPVSNLKLHDLGDGRVAFVVTGLVGDAGLYNQEVAQKGSAARIYDAEIPIWNESGRPNRSSLWYNELVRGPRGWTFPGQLINLIEDVDLEGPSRVYTADPCSDFDVCGDGIAFCARNLRERGPDGSPAVSVYFARLDSFSQPPDKMPRQIFIPTSLEAAAINNVRFTPDAASIGFLYTAHEDAYNTRLYLASADSLDAIDVFGLVTCVDGDDQNPPNAFEFAGSADAVILRSHQLGHQVLSHLTLQDGAQPRLFFTGSSCSAFYPLCEGDWDVLLTTSSNFVDSSLWQIVQVPEARILRTISSANVSGGKFDLSFSMVTEFWFEGADGHFIHSWMIQPKDFDEDQVYPWLLAPHGSPGMAWNNEWTTGANFASWAAKGYIVVLPNITGSSGYGLDFMRRIRSQRGDKPFQDLLSLVDYLEDVPYLDQERAVVLGNSDAAYLVNRLLGHDVAKKFCCAIYQSGATDPPVSLSHKDFVFDNFDKLDRSYAYSDSAGMVYENDLARSTFLNGWRNAPPTLIIHGEKDRQCSITETLTAFNSLQAQGVPSRLLTFPDEGHVITKPENLVMYYNLAWDWAKRCVSGDIEREDIF